MRICAKCGRESADDAHFCAGCGAPLGDEAPRREERKVVSVVFVDLVGSTAQAERLDPEDVRAKLAAYHARARAELEHFGGTVEKFIGDAVVAVFGAPVVHEDDPERAVRAALAIRDATAGTDVSLRIAVNTGEALVTLDARPAEGEGMVAGDVVNTAARLQSAAPIDGILVGEATYRATAHVIEYRPGEPVVAKGKTEPIAVWEAVAPLARFGVDVDEAPVTPLIGRAREIDILADSLARARQERSPQLVTLVGEPGIGKSRLVAELFRIVDEDPDIILWRQGRCLPYGDGVSYWALGEMAKAQAGVLESDAADEAEHKLSEAIESLVADPGEAAWVVRHLRPLIGLGGETMTSGDARSETFAAWRRFFEALGERGPTVVIFEDLHWADDGLLDFVDGLVERAGGVPLLVLCSARPELLARRPGWGGGKANAVTLSLSPLSDDDTARLVGNLLEQAVLPAETQQALLQRADGNPLFAEEYVRMLRDQGVLRREGEVWRLADCEITLPETVQGIVAARLDALPAAEKELLQNAAVVGKVFWLGAVCSIGEVSRWEAEERLHALERKEFVRRDRRASVAGEMEFAFRHVLVRDVAYGQIPRTPRAERHRRAGEWIETLAGGRTEDYAEMLAHHYVAAVDYGRAAGSDVSTLLPKAVESLVAAGDRAWSLVSAHSALAHYERAVSLDPSAADDPHLLFRVGRGRLFLLGGGEDELERAAVALRDVDPAAAAEAEIIRGEAVWQRGDRDGSFPHFERAAAAVEALPVSRQKGFVVGQVARFLALAGRTRDALELAERAIAMANELGDDVLLGDVLNTRGIARTVHGDRDGIRDLEQSLELAIATNSPYTTRAYINLGSTLHDAAGEVAWAEQLTREGLRHAERLGLGLSQRWFRGNLADATYHLGLWDESLELAEAEIGDPEPHYLQGTCRIDRGLVRLARGDTSGAAEDVEVAVKHARLIRDPQALLPALATWSFCLACVGDVAKSADALAELERARGELEVPNLPGAAIVVLAFALLELGREAELLEEPHAPGLSTPWLDAALAIARGDIVGAADILHKTGSVAFEAHARLRAAQRLAASGRRVEAASQLAVALSFYRGVGAAAAVREAEELLPAAG